MGQPLDRAFVEIVPDTRDFSRDLNRDLNRAYRQAERQTDATTDNIADSFQDAGDRIENTFNDISRESEVTSALIEDSFRGVGDDAADSFERAGERIEDALQEAQRAAARNFQQIELEAARAAAAAAASFGNDRNGFLRRVSRAFGELSQTASRAFESVNRAIRGGATTALSAVSNGLLQAGQSAASAGTSIAANAALYGALAIAAAALATVLGNLIGLLGLLPGALAVVVAGIAPMVVAFQGFGDAISAILSKDPEKITEALNGLTPAARSVAREFQRLLPVFAQFQDAVQEAFFAPLAGALTQIATGLLPSLREGFILVAVEIGKAFGQLAQALSTPKAAQNFLDIFTATSAIIASLSPALIRFAAALGEIAVAALPALLKLADGFAVLLDRFSAFLTGSTKNGEFNAFIDRALVTVKELGAIFFQVGRIIADVFGAIGTDGESALSGITEGLKAVADFFDTDFGKRVLRDLVVGFEAIAIVLGGTLLISLAAFGGAVVGTVELVKLLILGFKKLGPLLVSLGRFFKNLGISIKDGVVDGFNAVVDFFKELPGDIADFISAIPGVIADVFEAAFDQALRTIGIGIGLVLAAIFILPGLIVKGLQALPELVANLFTTIWNFARDRTIAGFNAIVSFAVGLPARILSAIIAVQGFVTNLFSDTVNGVRNLVVNGFNSIISFVAGVPSRIRGAFSAAGSFVADVGGDIVNAIKSFLNNAIDKINEGIASIDNLLPGSLPRIPRLARGGVVEARNGGTLAVLGEGGEDEIVSPVSLLRKLLQESGSAINFGPGSIVVEFRGAVPTDEQARATGNAVAQGIIGLLERQQARTLVRTI